MLLKEIYEISLIEILNFYLKYFEYKTMDWTQLLSNLRLGREEYDAGPSTRLRTVFQQDFDRILFSSAFRRLQNKTQVFLFQNLIMYETD